MHLGRCGNRARLSEGTHRFGHTSDREVQAQITEQFLVDSRRHG